MTSLSLLKQLLSMNLIVMVVFTDGVKILIFNKEHACSFVCIVRWEHQALSRTKKGACLVSSKGNMMQPGPLIMLQYT